MLESAIGSFLRSVSALRGRLRCTNPRAVPVLGTVSGALSQDTASAVPVFLSTRKRCQLFDTRRRCLVFRAPRAAPMLGTRRAVPLTVRAVGQRANSRDCHRTNRSTLSRNRSNVGCLCAGCKRFGKCIRYARCGCSAQAVASRMRERTRLWSRTVVPAGSSECPTLAVHASKTWRRY